MSNNPQCIPMYKVIDGKRYIRSVWGLAKRTAQEQATKMRRNGSMARVVHIKRCSKYDGLAFPYIPREGFYAVYARYEGSKDRKRR